MKEMKNPNPFKILRTAKKKKKIELFFVARRGVLVKVDRYKTDKHVY